MIRRPPRSPLFPYPPLSRPRRPWGVPPASSPTSGPPVGLEAVPERLDAFEHLRRPDRKSTRLNSSHLVISYAVFCLKKKKTAQVSPADAARRHRRHHPACPL